VAGRFHVRPHLSAALLSRLISSVLARLLSALDEGDLEDCDLVALALAVDHSSFTAELTAGSRAERRSGPGEERTFSQSVDVSRTERDSSLVALTQVTT